MQGSSCEVLTRLERVQITNDDDTNTADADNPPVVSCNQLFGDSSQKWEVARRFASLLQLVSVFVTSLLSLWVIHSYAEFLGCWCTYFLKELLSYWVFWFAKLSLHLKATAVFSGTDFNNTYNYLLNFTCKYHFAKQKLLPVCCSSYHY